VAIETFASFWVAVRVNGGDLALFDYWPVSVGNRWEYDNDFAITVTESEIQPNLPELVTLLSLVGSGVNEGLYIETMAGQTDTFGRYGLYAQSYQELLDQGLVFLPATARLGDEFQSTDDYDGYRPIGEMLPSYRGTEDITTRVLSEGRLQIPIGTFDDVLEVEVVSDFVDDRPASSTSTIRLWLARDVGPIQVELTGLPTTARLRQAQVDGVVVN